MSWRFCLIFFIGILLEWKLTHSAPASDENGKTKDKGRAYEFGFSIEEQQHRHEKRDENGIVMGEFGFITADGIYHVTVYATDENGKFKIISMKNYPYGNPEKKIMIATLPPAKKPVVTPTVIKAMKPDGKSCGGCVLPKKPNLLPADVMGKKQPNEEMAVFRPLSKALNDVSSNGKPNGGAAKVGKSTATNQSKSSSKTGSLPQGVDTQIPLINPRFSTSASKKPNAIGTTSSKMGPKTSTNNGNKYQLENSIPQTTQTPTRLLTQVPTGINTPKRINTRFGLSSGDNQFSRTGSSVQPTRHSNSLTSLNSQQALDNELNSNSSKHVTKFSTNNTNLNNTPQKLNKSLSKTILSQLQFPGNQILLERKTNNPEIPSKFDKGSGSPSPDSQFPIKTGRKSSLTGVFKTKKLSNPNIVSNMNVKQNLPKEFGLFGQENSVIENSRETGRNPLSISTKHSRPSPTILNSQKIYNTDSVKTKNPAKSVGTNHTNTTPQHFSNPPKQTNPTNPPFKQFPRNDRNKSENQFDPRNARNKPEISNRFGISNQETQFDPRNGRNKPIIRNRFGISSQENQFDQTFYEDKMNFPQVEGISQTNKFLNPLIASTTPTVVPTRFNTRTQSLSSFVSPSYNLIKSFEIPANNRKTPLSPQQQGPTNTFTQNAVKPILKTTKESKPFQTLSKFLPDQTDSKQSGVPISGQISPQTSTLTSSVPRKTLLQNSGQGPPLVTASPQSIGKNTQPQLTTKTLTPKRLQQNTNGAKTSTTNGESTKNKQTPVAPSSQTLGKSTSSTNPGGVGGSSSSGNVNGGGGGPLYRFKYVLDYNSHREEGRIDGSKEGKYNTIDDDGIRRIIDYIANENGYQPHIKLERPPPNELPTGENKLKEYEFVWFN